ncbi:MAG: hypothetical protein IPL65_19335 [Lewinellaceae bacterium]|nr:hypothetical protein [Lewinellaceae bacterium]
MIAASLGAFYRHFLQLKLLAPRFDKLVKWYTIAITAIALLVWILAAGNQGAVLQYVFPVVDTTNLIFTFIALISCRAADPSR